ncbi:glycosyltransferase family 4 protein [bacterium]|nr:glycosyltransferase family 4 protein [candidate division CSSED10-310 bacterium]
MSKVLVVSGDVIGRRMAGPAIRCLEMARALSANHSVTVATPVKPDEKIRDLRLVTFRNEPSADLLNRFDAVVLPGSLICSAPVAVPMVVDLYDPFILSNLRFWCGETAGCMDAHCGDDLSRLMAKLCRGDYFICASQRQRDFWLGMLAAAGRLTPTLHGEDPLFERFVGVVPFGIGDPPLPSRRPVLRGVAVDGRRRIAATDFLMIWGGGIWNWFDPVTLLDAMAEVTAELPRVKLYFMGTAHPNPLMPLMERTREAMDHAGRLGLLDRQVFFGDWAPYEERGGYLLEADLGVSLHFPDIETRFAYRTRLLDYFWAGLPVLTTEGDALAEVIRDRGMGLTVPVADAGAVAAAVRRLSAGGEELKTMAAAVRDYRPELLWRQAVAPLDEFLKAPRRCESSGDQGCAHLVVECADVVQETGTALVGTGQERCMVEQRFMGGRERLCRIDLLVSAGGSGWLHLRLATQESPDKIQYEEQRIVGASEDHRWITFRFAPLSDSGRRRYILFLELRRTNEAMEWGLLHAPEDRPEGSRLLVDGRLSGGCLALRTYWLRLPDCYSTGDNEDAKTTIWSRLRGRKP